MKKFLTLALAAAALLTCSCASTKRLSPTYLPPSTTGTRVAVTAGQERVTSAQAHVTQAQTHAKAASAKIVELEKAVAESPTTLKLVVELRGDVDRLTEELIQTQEALASAQVSLIEAQQHATDLQGQINTQTQTLNTTIETSNRNADKLASITKAYHKLKFYVCSLAAACVGLLLWKFKAVLLFLGPYALIAMIAGPAAVFGLLWLLL